MKERPILFSAPMVRALLDGSKTQTRRVVKPQPPEWASGYWGTVGTYSGLAEPIHYWEGEHPEYDEEGVLLWPSVDKWSNNPQWDRFEGTGLVSPYGSEKNCIKDAAHLWVREAWRACLDLDGTPPRDIDPDSSIEFEATKHSYAEIGLVGKLRPSIFMPRWASRITLEVTGVRVERLQAITETDAIAEGCITEEIISGYDGTSIKVPAEIPHPSGGSQGWDTAVDWYADLWESINGPGSWDLNPWVWRIEFKVITP